MAEERNVGLARAQDAITIDDDANATKEDLQRRMEEARESITQTVSEIKDSVTTQYQSVRESLDWREQYRRRPVAFSVGALGVGLLAGYGVAGAFAGGRSKDDDYDEDDDYMSSSPTSYVPPSYASQAITGSSAYAKSASESPSFPRTSAESTTPPTADYSAMSEPQKPGLVERFKGTQAFDRLQSEISTLGSRAVDELSHTAQSVVLPALLGKLKDMIGIDLSMQKREAERSQLEKQTSTSRVESVKANEQQAAAHESNQ